MRVRGSGQSANLRRSVAATAVASCFAYTHGAAPAHANPTGPAVKSGAATFQQSGGILQITNSPNAVIHWQGFSIDRGELTRFIQQNPQSAVLNRVIGASPSSILGALQSNGRVFLINPNGILFGAGAQVNVAGLVASSLNLTDTDFIAGRMRFGPTPGAGAVVNEGAITTPGGGQVYLIAPNVQNNGVITTPKGEVILAAGTTVELADTQTPLLRVEVSAPANEAVNAGTIIANGGRVSVYGTAIRNSGTINANTLVRGENGEILLKAKKDVQLTKGSVITASGPSAGRISIEAESGVAQIAGKIEANATTTPSPAAASGSPPPQGEDQGGGGVTQGGIVRGGTIDIRAGREITVDAQALITANGPGGGGTVTFNSSAGTTQIAGRIEAKAIASPPASTFPPLQGEGQGGGGVARGGTITLAADKLVITGTANAGGAAGGQVAVQAGSITQSGAILAEGTTSRGGVVDLQATGSIVQSPGAIVSAASSAGDGGAITIAAGSAGKVISSASLNVTGGGVGGAITVIAKEVELRESHVDASGDAGGGLIRLGGDFQGKGTIPNLRTLFVDRYTRIRADARGKGDGGRVILWSDENTQFYGDITARGGEVGGNGGFVEVSGKEFLTHRGTVDLRAPQGRTGTLLLDPDQIVIQGGTGSSGFAGTIGFNDSGTITTIFESEIEEQSKSSNIILQARSSISIGNNAFNYVSSGNLGVENPGIVALASGSSLTLQTRNAAGEVGGINLTGGVHGSSLQFLAQGTGSITIQTGVGGSVGTPISLGILAAGQGGITVTAGGGTTGADVTVNNIVRTINAGPLSITAPGTLAIAASPALVRADQSGAITLTSDHIVLAPTSLIQTFGNGGTLGTGGAVTLRPHSLSRNITIENSDGGSSLSLTPAELQRITTSTLEIGRSDGTGTLTVASGTSLLPGDVNAGLLRLLHGQIVVNGNLGNLGAELASSVEALAAGALTVSGGNIRLADTNSLTLRAGGSGTGQLTIGGGTTTQVKVGTGAGNTGTMTLQGNGIVVESTAAGAFVNVDVTGSGNQSLISTGDITVSVSGGGPGAGVSTVSGTQFIDTTGAVAGGALSILGGTGANGARVATTGGSQDVNLNGGLILQAGASAGAVANLTAVTGQTIAAKFIEIAGSGDNAATITNSTSGEQRVTTNGANASGEGIVITNPGTSFANITNNGTGPQIVTVNNADRVRIVGEVGSASISSPSGDQTFLMKGAALNVLEIGEVTAAHLSSISGRNQSVIVGETGQNGSIILRGGVTDTRNASISGSGVTQTVSTTGDILAVGGSAGGTAGSDGSIFHSGTGLQSVTAREIRLLGGSTGTLNSGVILTNNPAGTGGQIITARNIEITGNTGGHSFIQNTNQGAQTITTSGKNAAGEGISVRSFGNSGTSFNTGIFNTGTASPGQSITVNDADQVVVAGIGGAAFINSSGSGQTLKILGGGQNRLQIGAAGALNQSSVQASGTQIVTVGTLTQQGGIEIIGGASDGLNAQISQQSADAAPQTVTTTGLIGITGGSAPGTFDGTTAAGGSIARIRNQGTSGPQTVQANGIVLNGGTSGINNQSQVRSLFDQEVTVGSGGIMAIGGGGTVANHASIQQVGTIGTQTVTINNGGTVSLKGGSSIDTTVDTPGSNGEIRSDGTLQKVEFTSGGTIVMTGGTVGDGNQAFIRAETPGTGQMILGSPSMSLTGGASGGSPSEGNTAYIFSDGSQTVAASGMSLTGGSGTNNFAGIRSVDNQTITVGAGGITLIGGTGTVSNHAQIFQTGTTAGLQQSITINGGGTISLQGGSSSDTTAGTAGSNADIRAEGTVQQITFTSPGTLKLTGGTGPGNGNQALIRAENTGATQTISGSPFISITGGSSGGAPDEQNNASIFSNGLQQIGATAITLLGGPGGVDNSATITAPGQNITVTGNVLLTGGDNGTLSGGARIGGRGSNAPVDVGNSTDLTLTVTGDVTLAGGATSAATLGSSLQVAGATNTIDLGVGGNLSLNPSAGFDARIGSPGSDVQSGNISIVADGNISLNGGGGAGIAVVRTLGNVGVTANTGNVNVTDSLITAGGTLAIAASGTLSVTANNRASTIETTGAGMQTISVGAIVMNAANTGSGRSALINASAGQDITAGAAGISLRGGSGSATGNQARIEQFGAGRAQTITINGGGTLTLRGGDGSGTNNEAGIVNDGALQTIHFGAAGSALNITGGTVGGVNDAGIDANAGNQVISGNPDITLRGGASGGADGNQAVIIANVGTQTISANNLTILGGDGDNAVAGIFADPGAGITINTAGTTVLTGGSGADSAAFIGSSIGAVGVTLNAGGAVTITGGTGPVGGEGYGAIAGIGATGTFNADVTINAQSGITLNKGVSGARADARIGSDAGGGDIVLKTGLGGAGDLALNDGIVRTTGNVALEALGGGISQGAGGVVRAGTLTTTSDFLNMPGRNLVGSVLVTTTGVGAAGNIAFANAQDLVLPANAINTVAGSTQTVNIKTIAAGADINITGNSSTNDNVTIISSGTIGGTGTITGASVTQSLGNIWIAAGGGSWHTGSNWSRGAAPDATQDAYIENIGIAGADAEIIVSTPGQAARSVVTTEHFTINGSGVLTLGSGTSSVTGALTIINGTLTADGPLTTGSVILDGASGLLNGDGIVTPTVGMTWNGGTIGRAGTLVIPSGSALNSGSTALRFLGGGRVIDNAGSITLTGPHDIQIPAGGATVLNQPGGVFTFTDNSTFENAAGAIVFVNSGTVQKTGSAGGTVSGFGTRPQTSFLGLFTNVGTAGGVVNVNSGTLSFFHTGGGTSDFQAGSTISVANGATVMFEAGAHTVSGAISGQGGVTVQMGTTTIQGAYNATGPLSVTSGIANFSPTAGMNPSSTTISGATTVANFNTAVTLANTVTFDAANQAQIGGTGNLTLNGSFIWSGGGDLTGTGVFRTNGTTTVSHFENGLGKPWDNFGTVNITAGGQVSYFQTASTWTNKAGGIVNLQGSSTEPIRVFDSSGHSFVNEGIVNKGTTSAPVQQIGTATLGVSNSGPSAAINVNGGTLLIAGSGTDTGAYAVTGGATLAFIAARTLNLGTSFSGAGEVNFAGANVNVNTNLTIANPMRFSGSDLQTVLSGSGNVTLNGPLTWQNGVDIVGTGTLTTNGAASVTSFSAGLGNGRTWVNNGVVNLDGTASIGFFGPAAATWTNTGTGVINLNGSNTAPVFVASGSGHNFFNQGTINKAIGSAGTMTIGDANLGFSNTGTAAAVNVDSGTLSVAGAFTQAGLLNVGPGATLQKTGGFTNTGVLKGGGTFNVGAGTLTNRGTIEAGASPGTLSITGNLVLDGAAGSVTNIEIAGTGAGQFDVINVTGTVSGTGAGNLDWGTINVSNGTFTPAPGNSFTIMNYGTRVGDFTTKNLAGYTEAVNPGNYVLALGGALKQWAVDASGFWDVGSNWTGGIAPIAGENVEINRAGGTFTVTVRDIAGAGAQFAGTLAMTGDEKLVIAGDSLTLGSGASSINDLLTVSGGTLNNGGTLTAVMLNLSGGTVTNSPAAILSVGTLTMSAGTLSGAGNVNVTDAYNRTGGTFNIGGTASINQAAGNLNLADPITAAGLTLNAAGTIAINTGAAINLGGGMLAIVPAAGALLGGGSISNATIANSGTGLRLSANSAISGVTLDADLAISGNLILFTNGTIGIAAGRALSLQAGVGNFAVLRLGTSTTFDGPGAIVFGGTSSNNQIDNNAGGQTLTFGSGLTVGGATSTRGGSISGFVVLNNAGMIDAAAPGQTISVSATSVANTGTLRARNGGSLTTGAGFTTNDGVIDIGSASVFSTGNNNLTNAGTGTIQGSGRLLLTTGTAVLTGRTLTNNGTLAAGNSPGRLTINGDLVLTGTSVTSIEIANPGTAGVDYDLIAVTGTATLGGTLNVTHLGGFVPSGGQTFTIMTYGAHTGDFSTKNAEGAAFPGLFGYTGAANATYQLTAIGVGTNNWINPLGGDWNVAGNWSLGHIPTATELAIVNIGTADFAVTYGSTGSQPIVGALQNAETLRFTGGTLTLAGSSTSTGILDVAGGTLAIGSTAGINLTAHTLNLSSGTVSGTGNLTVTNTYTQTGGTINLTGTTSAVSITQAAGNLAFGGPVTANQIAARAAGGISNAGGVLTTTGGKLLLSAGDALAGVPNGGAALTVSGALASGNGDITLQNTGTAGITINANVNAGAGTVRLAAPAGPITEVPGLVIAAGALGVDAAGPVDLFSHLNNLGTIAGRTTGTGTFSVRSAGSLTIGSVGAADAFSNRDGLSVIDGTATILINDGVLTVSNTPAALDIDAGRALLNLSIFGPSTGRVVVDPGVAVSAGAVLYGGPDIDLAASSSTTALGSSPAAPTTGNIQFTYNQSNRRIFLGAGSNAGGTAIGISNAELATLTATGAVGVGGTAWSQPIETDGALVVPAAVAGGLGLLTNGQNITLDHDVTIGSGALSVVTTGPGHTVAAGRASGTGRLTLGAGGAGGLFVRSGAGMSFENAANQFATTNLLNDLPGSTGSIAIRNNHDLQVVNATNAASGGTISIINNTGSMLISGGGAYGTTGAGDADVTFQTAGQLSIAQPVSAGGTGSVTLQGTGIHNVATVTGPGGIVANAGTGTFTNAFTSPVVRGVLTNAGGSLPVEVIADDVNLQTGSEILGTAGTVWIHHSTPNRNYDLGTETVGKLSLTGSELNTITAGVMLRLGDTSNTGTFDVSAPIAPTNFPTLSIRDNGAAAGISASGSGSITIASLALASNQGAIALNGNNNVSNLAVSRGSQAVSFNNTGSLTIGGPAIDGLSGITMTGTGGNVSITAGGPLTVAGTVAAGGTSNVTFASDRMNLAGATISSGTGGVTLLPRLTTTAIDIGSTTDLAAALELSGAELNTITTAGPLTIGQLTQTGAITVSNPITLTNPSGGVTLVNSAAGIAANANWNSPGTLILNSQSGNVDFAGGITVAAAGLNLPGSGSANFASGTVTLNASVASSMPVNVGSATVNFSSGGTLSAAVTNAGTINANAGTLNLAGGGTHTGAFNAASDATLAFTGGTHDLNVGASVAGSGTVALSSGTVNVNTPLNTGGLTINHSGGTLDNPSPLTVGGTYNWTGGTLQGAGTVDFNGPLNWSQGSLGGGGTVTINGVLSLDGGGSNSKPVDGRTVVHTNSSGASSIANTAQINFNNGAVFRNAAGAVLNVNATSGNTSIDHDTGINVIVENLGTINKLGGGTFEIMNDLAGTFVNSGTFNVVAGTLTFTGGASVHTFPVNAGLLSVSAGATVLTNGKTLTNTGTIQGGGTINLGAGVALTNGSGTAGGTLNAGTSPGKLTIVGDLVLTPSSVTNIEIQNTGTAGVDYDVINVSGSATLAGALNVTHLGGFTPSGGSSFQVMSYASRTGDFASKSFPASFNYTTQPNAASYVLVMDAQTNTWVALTGDWGATPGAPSANWSLGHVPTAGEVVVIPDVGVPGLVDHTITVNASGQAAKSITNREFLDIASGGLTFSDTSTSTGVMQVSGGTLTANGNLTASALNLSAGTLNGAGNVIVTSSYTQTAGAIDLGGSLSINQGSGSLVLGQIAASAITATAQAGSIAVAGALASPGTILLDARGAGGDVTVAAGITTSAGADATLEVRAGNNIFVTGGARITSTGNKLHVVLDSDRDGDGAGAIFLGAGTLIESRGGNITLGGGIDPLSTAAIGAGGGVVIDSSTLDARGGGSIRIMGSGNASGGVGVGLYGANLLTDGSGNVAIRGQGGGAPGNPNFSLIGIDADGSASIDVQGSGAVQLIGFGGNSTQFLNDGIYLHPGVQVTANSGVIDMQGYAGIASGPDGNNVYGIRIQGASVQSTGGAPISLQGTGGTSVTGGATGVGIYDGGVVTSNTGAITITGTGGSSAGVQTSNAGVGLTVNLLTGSVVSTGSASITITGTGGSNSAGVELVPGSSVGGASANGDITLTSLGGAGLLLNGAIQTSPARNITLDASGGGGVAQNGGVIVGGGLRLSGSGPFNLAQSGNNVSTLAANLTGASSLVYRNAGALSIGSVAGATGIALPGAGGGTVTIYAGGSLAFAGAAGITAGSVTLNAAGTIVSGTAVTDIDTAASNGAISVTATGLGNAIGAAGNPLTTNAGAGSVTTTTNRGDVFVEKSVGDLVTSRYALITGSGGAPITGSLSTAEGRIIVDDAGSWNSGDNIAFTTAGANRDIEFTSAGTFTANSLSLNGTGSARFAAPAITFATPVTANLPVAISGGAVDFEAMSSLTTLNLSGGTLGGGGAVTLNGVSNWSGGTLAGTGTTTIAGGATLNAASGATLSASRALANSGTFNVNGGTVQLGAFPANAGSLTVAGGATFEKNGGFTNTGVLGGNGTVAVGTGNALTNQGTLRAGASPGTLTVTGDLVLDGVAGSVVAVEIDGTAAGQYDVIKVSGQVRGTGPTQENWGTLSVTHGGTFTPGFGNLTIMTYEGRTGDFTTKVFPPGLPYETNAGPVNYVLGLGGLTNFWQGLTGNWETAGNWSLGHVPTASELVVIPDVGAAGVSDTITVNAAGQRAKRITNAEVLQIVSGDLLFTDTSMSSGTVEIAGGALSADGNLKASTLNLSGGTLGAVAAMSAGTLTQSGGTLAGAGGITVSGTWNYTAGDINTVVTLGAGSTSTLNGVTVSGTGSITNLGTLALTDSTLSVPVVNSSPVRLSGINTITSGAGITGGAVEFLGGTASFQAGSTYAVDTTRISGAETVASFGNLATTGTLDSSGGTLAGGGGLTVNGTWNYSAGNVDTTLMLASGSSSTLTNVTVTGAGTITNHGLLGLDNAIVIPLLTNQGTLRTATGSENAINALTNPGTMDLGALSVLEVPGALLNNGMIRGNGTLRMGSAAIETLTNEGRVAPGASPGTLVIEGNFVQGPNGTLEIELDGTPGTLHDLLRVTGTVSLAGSLRVVLPDGFNPEDGNGITIMEYASRTGDFSTGLAPAGYTVNRAPNGTSYTISFLTPVAAPREVPNPPDVPPGEAAPLPSNPPARSVPLAEAALQEIVEITTNALVIATANLGVLAGPGAPGGSGAGTAFGTTASEREGGDTAQSAASGTAEGGQQEGAAQKSKKPPVCQ